CVQRRPDQRELHHRGGRRAGAPGDPGEHDCLRARRWARCPQLPRQLRRHRSRRARLSAPVDGAKGHRADCGRLPRARPLFRRPAWRAVYPARADPASARRTAARRGPALAAAGRTGRGPLAMIIDARSHEGPVECEVAVVGAGPAGMTVAMELERQGVDVAVFESGGRDFDHETHRLTEGASTGYPYHRLDAARERRFGGTSWRWPRQPGWRARPLDPIDFEPRDGMPESGWPFSRDDLWPY